MKQLVCKICRGVIGTVDIDNLTLPLKPAHFTPKSKGYPHPFNPMGKDFTTCFCPLCKKLAIDEDSCMIIDGELGLCVVTVGGDGCEVEPYLDAAEEAAKVAEEAHIQYSAIVAVDDKGIRILPQEEVEIDGANGEVGTPAIITVAVDGNISITPADDMVYDDDGTGSEDEEIAKENAVTEQTIVDEEENDNVGGTDGDPEDEGSVEGEGDAGEAESSESEVKGTESEDTPSDSGGVGPEEEDGGSESSETSDTVGGGEDATTGTTDTWAVVVKESGEIFEFEGRPTSGLTEEEAGKALHFVRSKGNGGLIAKELD